MLLSDLHLRIHWGFQIKQRKPFPIKLLPKFTEAKIKLTIRGKKKHMADSTAAATKHKPTCFWDEILKRMQLVISLVFAGNDGRWNRGMEESWGLVKWRWEPPSMAFWEAEDFESDTPPKLNHGQRLLSASLFPYFSSSVLGFTFSPIPYSCLITIHSYSCSCYIFNLRCVWSLFRDSGQGKK